MVVRLLHFHMTSLRGRILSIKWWPTSLGNWQSQLAAKRWWKLLIETGSWHSSKSMQRLITYMTDAQRVQQTFIARYSPLNISIVAEQEIQRQLASAKGSAKNVKRKLEDFSSSDTDDGKEAKKARGKKSKVLLNPTATSFNKADFLCDAKTTEGKPWNLKISSWNVNGLRALIDKNGLDFINYEEPHIFCVQETKCSKEKLPSEATIKGYTAYWLSGDTDGYSGVGLYTNITPLNVKYGIGNDKHDQEGRVITAEYEKFYLVAVYVPNAGRKLVRLDGRMDWDVAFRNYLQELDKEKPVILCGDLNVAHKEIDLANPKTNKRSAGFTEEERGGFTTLLEAGFVDSFRHLHPDVTKAYTFWTYMMNARAKDVGWRLDYFVISKRLLPNLCENVIRKSVLGSDHCPITLFMSF